MRERQPPPVPLVKQKGRPPSLTRRCPVEVRFCKHHGETEFALYSGGKPRRRWRCKRCVGEAVTRRLQKMKRILVEEAGGSCAICGYRRTVVNLISTMSIQRRNRSRYRRRPASHSTRFVRRQRSAFSFAPTAMGKLKRVESNPLHQGRSSLGSPPTFG